MNALRSVIAFIASPSPQYVAVSSMNFGSVFPLPGSDPRVPSQPKTFPNRSFNKAGDIPLMNVQTVYNYDRAGKMQY